MLKHITRADFEEVLDMFREPHTFKFIPHLENKTEKEYREFLNIKVHENREQSGFYWIGRHLKNREFVGSINLNRFGSTQKIQIGFQIRRKYWGQGYGSEMASRVLEFALKERKLKTIYGIFEKENIASGRVLEKMGFVFDEQKLEAGRHIQIFKYQVSEDQRLNRI